MVEDGLHGLPYFYIRYRQIRLTISIVVLQYLQRISPLTSCKNCRTMYNERQFLYAESLGAMEWRYLGLNFSDFMSNTIKLLCEHIRADEETIRFQIGDRYHGAGVHFDTEVKMLNQPSVWLCVVSEYPMDPVIYHTMFVLHRYLSNNASLKPDANSGWFFNVDGGVFHTPATLAEEIYRIVCAELIDRYSLVSGVNISLLSAIIMESYETTKASGTFAFVEGNWRSGKTGKLLRTKLKPKKPIEFEPKQKRHIRKLLQGAGGDILLLSRENRSEPYCCVGYVASDADKHFPLTAHILRRDTWSFRYAKQDVFRVRMGDVLCLQDPVKLCLSRLEEELGAESIRPMQDAINAVSNQMHGTSMVFLDLDDIVSKERIERLQDKGRALKIERLPIAREKCTRLRFLQKIENDLSALTKLAGVDGALIVDYPKGEIAYINAILDGDAIVPGDPASGARWNVISCFIANLVQVEPDVKAAALIFSEDGGCRLVKASTVER